MSYSAIPGKPVQIIDETINLHKDFEYGVVNGSEDVSFIKFPSVTNPGTAFSIITNTISKDAIIDPEILIQVVYNFSFAGAGVAGQNLVQSGQDGPRQFPIHNTMQQLKASIGNNETDSNIRLYFDAISRTSMYYDALDLQHSLTPSYPDEYSEYSYNAAGLANIVGDNRNPLSTYGANTTVSGRSSFAGLNLATNTQTACTGTLTATERVFLTPFADNKKGIWNIETMNFNFTFQNLNMIWSRSPNHTAGAVTMTTSIAQAFVMFKYIKAKLPTQLKLSKEVAYNYHEVNLISSSNTTAALAPFASQTVNLQNVNIAAIPKRLLIFAREQQSDFYDNPAGFTKADSFARITKAAMTFGIRQNILSQADETQLYNMSRKNGMKISWNQWAGMSNIGSGAFPQLEIGGVGSVLILDVGVDIPLEALYSPGSTSNPQVGGQITIQNINPSRSVVYTVYLFVIFEGVLSILGPNNVQKTIAPLSYKDVLETLEAPVYKQLAEARNIYGGDFFKDVWEGIKKVGSFAKENVLPVVKDLAPLARTLLLGLGKKKKKGRGAIGGDIVGGRKITRQELKHRLGGSLSDKNELFDYADDKEFNKKTEEISDSLLEMIQKGDNVKEMLENIIPTD